jgi:hypothetical protein
VSCRSVGKSPPSIGHTRLIAVLVGFLSVVSIAIWIRTSLRHLWCAIPPKPPPSRPRPSDPSEHEMIMTPPATQAT